MSAHLSFSLPGDTALERPDFPWEFTHLKLVARIDIEAGRVRGEATWTCAPKRPEPGPIVLDGVGLDVTQVLEASGEPLEWTNDGRRITVHSSPEPTAISLSFSSEPDRGLHFVRPDEHYPDLPVQVWTQGQDEDHHFWFPCADHPAVRFTQELCITIPEGLQLVSNGHCVSEVPAEPGWVTHSWRFDTPHITYLLSFAAGHFERIELPGGPDNLPVYALVEPKFVEMARHNLGATGRMIGFFSEYLDYPYPYEQYAQVCVAQFTFGGMENTSATTLTDLTLHPAELEDDYSSAPLVAHELAHQWFGDLISVRDWPHAWLHEGFATYFELLWRQHDKGDDEFHYGMKCEADGYFYEDRKRYRRSIVTHTRHKPIDIFDAHLYEKGSWVVHMLRHEIGESSFRSGLRDYLLRFGSGHVETGDLRRCLEDASGRDLRWFFDQWLMRGGHPEISAKLHWDEIHQEVVVDLSQSQEEDEVTPLFRLPLEIRMSAGDRSVSKEITLSGRQTTFRFSPGFRPERVVIDPEEKLLKTLTQRCPPDWLRNQLRSEELAAVRIRAVEGLAASGQPRVASDLAGVLAEDPFWGVRAEAAKALANLRSDAAKGALTRALADAHPKVRRAAASGLGSFLKDEPAASALIRCIEADASPYVVGDACAALGKTRDERAERVLLDQLERDSHNATIAKGSAMGLVATRTEAATTAVMAKTSYGNPSPLRWTAATALGNARVQAKEVRELLEKNLDDLDFRMRFSAADALGELGEKDALAALQRARGLEQNSRVMRSIREAVRGLSNDSSNSQRVGQLEDTIAGLKSQLGVLTERLERLEREQAVENPDG